MIAPHILAYGFSATLYEAMVISFQYLYEAGVTAQAYQCFRQFISIVSAHKQVMGQSVLPLSGR